MESCSLGSHGGDEIGQERTFFTKYGSAGRDVSGEPWQKSPCADLYAKGLHPYRTVCRRKRSTHPHPMMSRSI